MKKLENNIAQLQADKEELNQRIQQFEEEKKNEIQKVTNKLLSQVEEKQSIINELEEQINQYEINRDLEVNKLKCQIEQLNKTNDDLIRTIEELRLSKNEKNDPRLVEKHKELVSKNSQQFIEAAKDFLGENMSYQEKFEKSLILIENLQIFLEVEQEKVQEHEATLLKLFKSMGSGD